MKTYPYFPGFLDEFFQSEADYTPKDDADAEATAAWNGEQDDLAVDQYIEDEAFDNK